MRSRDSAEAPVLLKALHTGVIQQMFALSNPATARKLLKDWTRFPGAKPLLERVADYFGTGISFYSDVILYLLFSTPFNFVK